MEFGGFEGLSFGTELDVGDAEGCVFLVLSAEGIGKRGKEEDAANEVGWPRMHRHHDNVTRSRASWWPVRLRTGGSVFDAETQRR